VDVRFDKLATVELSWQHWQQCHIKGGARGAAAPGPAVLGARNWLEW